MVSAAWWNPVSWFNKPAVIAPEVQSTNTGTVEAPEKAAEPIVKTEVLTKTIKVSDPALQKQIDALTNQVASLQQQLNECNSKPPVIQTITITEPAPTSAISSKEAKLREIDAQMLPLLNEVDTSDFNTYIKNLSRIISLYKIADSDFNLILPGKSSTEGYASYEQKLYKFKVQLEDYIKYRN